MIFFYKPCSLISNNDYNCFNTTITPNKEIKPFATYFMEDQQNGDYLYKTSFDVVGNCTIRIAKLIRMLLLIHRWRVYWHVLQ